MSVPTISGISPIAGHTGGRTLVQIDGSGFRPQTPQTPVRGITPQAPPSVEVLFGSTPALEVLVLSDAVLYATTPISDPGAVNVTVRNIDDAGTPLAGETVTRVKAYTFLRPDITIKTDLVRCVETFVIELKRQILPNVNWPAAVDYDDTTGDERSISKLANVPALIIADVTLRENDFYATRDNVEVENADGTTTEQRPPTTVDIVVILVGVSDNSSELLNLSAATKSFFRKNAYLMMRRDAADASKGSVQYDLTAHESPDVKLTITANVSDMRHFVMTCAILGFDIEGMQGLGVGGPGDGGRDHDATVAMDRPAETIQIDVSRNG